MALHSRIEFGMQYHVQTSINNLNVFKSFQLMLVPPSNLLSNAMKLACINTRSFKDVLTSMSSDYMCHHSRQY